MKIDTETGCDRFLANNDPEMDDFIVDDEELEYESTSDDDTVWFLLVTLTSSILPTIFPHMHASK